MKFSRNQFQTGLLLSGWLLAGSLLAGCGHLYYADPNPATPFAFPGQNQTAVAQAQMPAPDGSAAAPVNTLQLAPVTAPVATQAPPAAGPSASDILRIGDSITVAFSDIPFPGLLPVTQRIRDDGKITLPYNVTLGAAGKTVGQLQEEIRSAYVPNIFVHMTPSVNSEERVFFVEGEVKLASRLPYKGEMTVLRAITSAGGFTDFAQRKKIELRRATGQKLFINWYKAIEDTKADLPVYPNDQIIVRKKLW